MEPMLNIALRAARKAAELIERATERVDLIAFEEKGRNDYVSEIDRKAEQEVLYHLKKAYPDHGFLGEESGATNTESDYQWVIDPLDGTTNFLRGVGHYSVSIACLHKGQPTHAVVLDPLKRDEFTASRGRGATLNGRRIRCSARLGLQGGLIGTGVPFNGIAYDNIDPYLAALREIAGVTAGVRRMGSAALDLAYVAAGRFDGYWEMNLKPWDMAAGVLLVKEAGGLLSDFKGGHQFMETGNIVCGGAKVFKPLLQVVGKHLGEL